MKKALDKVKRVCYTMQALREAPEDGTNEKRAERFEEKDRKKFEKLLKSLLTNENECAILIRSLSRRRHKRKTL